MHISFSRSLSRAVPINLLGAICHVPLLVPYYHMVSDRQIPHLSHLYPYKNLRQFSEDLDFLTRNYTPIDLREVLRSIHNGTGFRKKKFLLVFDDGFREIYEVIAPVLHRKGIPAVFFLCTGFIDNKKLCFEHKASLLAGILEKQVSELKRSSILKLYLDKGFSYLDPKQAVLNTPYSHQDLLDEVANVIDADFNEYLFNQRPYLTSDEINKLLENGFSVGAHSIDHPRYIELTDDEKVYQTVQSVRDIRRLFGLEYGVFAFPHSDAKISMNLLERIHQSGIVDATFGNQGMLKEPFPCHLQRFSLEKPCIPARDILVKNYCRKLFKDLSGRGVVQRLIT